MQKGMGNRESGIEARELRTPMPGSPRDRLDSRFPIPDSPFS
jgi:hypothetical protein